jgi:hypothetical protein
MAETDDKPDAKFVGLWEATWRRGYSTEERRAMSKKVLLDPSTGLEDRNARPEVVAAKLHEMAEHCGGNALVIGPTERGVLWNHLARVLIPAAERCERICQGDPGPDDEEQE